MIKNTIQQINELTANRQRLSIRIYAFIYIIGLLGATGSILSNPLSNLSVKLNQLIPLTIVISISLLILYVLHKNIGKVSWIDIGIFFMTIILYSIIAMISIGKILSIIIWVPLFVVFLFALMNIKLSYIFIIIHLGITLMYNVQYPAYTYEVTKSTYVSMYTVIILLLITVPKVVNLFLEYQKKIFDDIDILNKKNAQVNLLLEENELQNDQLTQLVYRDPLTGLLNRQGFINIVDNELISVSDPSFFVLLIDILQFRNINSVYGYEFGDKILRYIAATLNDSELENKYIARVGNDTFAFVIRNICIAELEESLNKNLIGSIFIKEHGINIKYRSGVSYCCDKEKTAIVLLNEADIALGKTKEEGIVNYYIYDIRLDIEVRNRFNMLMALEKAIKNKSIFVQYQPIFDTKIGKIVSFEALARWDDKYLGFVSPDVFIKLAEKSALIHELGDLIVDSVFQFASRLKDNSHDYSVTINISYKQLQTEDFAQRFIEQMRVYNIDPSKIGIEITESVLIDNFDLVVDHLNKLRNEGVKIYLDDFGTGYSSLNYLDQLPIDILKIDKTFVDEILSNKRKRDLLETIVHLAKQFDMSILAEGVETYDQAVMLEQTEIHMMQGYYFSKPLSEETLYNIL